MGISDLPRLDGVLISHDHYDHCDLAAFAAYRDRSVPLLVAETVVDAARRNGFHNVTALKPWEEAEAGGVTITATPAKHGVYEVIFVLRSGPQAVYFAGDTMLIPRARRDPPETGPHLPGLAAHQRPAHPPREQHAGRHERPGGRRADRHPQSPNWPSRTTTPSPRASWATG